MYFEKKKKIKDSEVTLFGMGEKIDLHEESRHAPPVQGLKKGEFKRDKEGY